MPYYYKLGKIPHKRHVQFKKPSGKLYREEVMGLEGFSSIQSILYHHFLPPRVTKVEDLGPAAPETVDFGPIRHRAFRTAQIPLGADPVSRDRLSPVAGGNAHAGRLARRRPRRTRQPRRGRKQPATP